MKVQKNLIKHSRLIMGISALVMASLAIAFDEGNDIEGNVRFGSSAGSGLTIGLSNTLIGQAAGENIADTESNTYIGREAGRAHSAGNLNTYVGRAAGANGASTANNTIIGAVAGLNNSANNVVLIGYEAGKTNQSEGSTFIGYQAGQATSNETANTFIGYQAGFSNGIGTASAIDNTFVGYQAGNGNQSGFSNSFFGKHAGNNSTGSRNTFVGAHAGQINNASSNTFVGYQAGFNNTSGDVNNFFGIEAGHSNTTGSDNSFFGTEAGWSNTEGSSNSFFGTEAGYANTTGFDNSMFGLGAGVQNKTGNFNSFFGNRSGLNNTSGLSNSFFGHGAGSVNTTGSNNSAFGRFANLSDGLTNATAIGNQAKVEQSNAMVLGSIPGVNDCGGTCPNQYVDVGIGTSTPAAPLHIQRTTSSGPQEMFRFTNTGGSYITWEKTTGNQKWFFTHENAAAGRLIMDHQDNGGLDGPEFALDTDGNIVVPGQVTASSFNTVSDRNAKQGIEELEGTMVLAKLEEIPVSQWRYKTAPETKHIGPMAQDFHAAFGLGADDKHISPTDMAGVALAAVKALKSENEALRAGMVEKENELDGLKNELAQALRAIEKIQARLDKLEPGSQ